MANVVVTRSTPSQMYPSPFAHAGKKYAKIYSRLGITELVSGTLSAIFGITTIAISSSDYRAFSPLSYASSGIWCGMIVIVAGILGLVSGKRPEVCPITAAMIVTIFAAVGAGAMVSIEVPAAVYSDVMMRSYGYRYSEYPFRNNRRSRGQRALTAIHAILAVIAFIQLVVAIVHSAYCCAATCCARPPGGVVSRYETANTTTTIQGQIPTAATSEQPVPSVSTPSQFIGQGQSVLATPPGYQQMQQPAFTNQAYYIHESSAQVPNGPFINSKPLDYQM